MCKLSAHNSFPLNLYLCRDLSIRPSILRIFTIWEQRNVFRGAFLEELRSLVTTEKSATPPDEKKEEKKTKEKVKDTGNTYSLKLY